MDPQARRAFLQRDRRERRAPDRDGRRHPTRPGSRPPVPGVGAGGPAGAAVPALRPTRAARPGAADSRWAGGARRPARGDHPVVAPMVLQGQARRSVRRGGGALGHGAEVTHPRAHGRDGGGPDHVPSRGHRRPGELGLPVQLDPRLELRRPLARPAGVRGRGGRVPAVRRAQRGRPRRGPPDRVRRRGRAADRGERAGRSPGVSRIEARSDRQRRGDPAAAGCLRAPARAFLAMA